jgi:putative ABC transport system permease protein
MSDSNVMGHARTPALVVVSVGIALRALRVNVLRSVLTTLGIIIGVGAVIAMVSVGAGAQARVAEQIRSLGSNLVYLSPGSSSSGGVKLGYGSRPTITAADATAISREIPSVFAAAPSIWKSTQIVYGNMNWPTDIQGTSPAFEDVRGWPVVAGAYFSDDDVEAATKVALLGQTVATNLFGVEDPVGQVIRIAQVPFTVLGVLERKGQNAKGQDQDDTVLIPITTAVMRVIGPGGPQGGAVHGITVKIRDGEDVKAIESQMRQLLRQRHNLQSFQDDDFRIRNLSEMLQAEEESTRTLTLLLGAVASVSLIVGGIGIMNIMLVSVTERTREIGLRMAVGARRTEILTQFLVEAITLALVGGFIGIGLGIAASYAIAHLATWRTLIDIRALVLAFGFAAMVGVFFGFYPARKAAMLDPIQALRYE